MEEKIQEQKAIDYIYEFTLEELLKQKEQILEIYEFYDSKKIDDIYLPKFVQITLEQVNFYGRRNISELQKQKKRLSNILYCYDILIARRK